MTEAGFRVIAPCRPGFGHSEHAGGCYDYDTMTENLVAAMTGTDATDAALVGFSVGRWRGCPLHAPHTVAATSRRQGPDPS
ncbi:alpha/beta fold hydrolase [Roseovarius pacificus]|uniref:alpha/beta fold hydrolase n=1 Tax=Roseovarius pacificus TaxID=337701 RepID=UPI003571436F